MGTTLKITRNSAHEVQDIRWVSRDKFTYSVQISHDLSTWDTYAGPYSGEDDTELVLPIPHADRNANFRLLMSVATDYSIPAYTITAFSGQYVIVNWENLGPVNGAASYVVVRDGTTIATLASDKFTYKDNAVVSRRTYRYDIYLRP